MANYRLFYQISVRAILVGVSILWATWIGNLSDYMLLEDHGLENSDAAKLLYKANPIEQANLLFSLAVTGVGLLGLIASQVMLRIMSDRHRNS